MVSNDFSVFALFTAGLATLVSAQRQADFVAFPAPVGNPTISPAGGENVAAGAPYAITWTPTTEGAVSIYLCKGLSANCVIQSPPIAVAVPNSGSFSWNVSPTLEASAGQGYGIQIVVESNGQYQYTPQFGITNNAAPASSAAAPASSAAAPSGYAPPAVSSAVETHPAPAPSSAVETHPAPAPTSTVVAVPTGTGGFSSVIVQPTATPTVPSNLPAVSSTTPPGSQFTGAASRFGAGVAVVGAAVAALAL